MVNSEKQKIVITGLVNGTGKQNHTIAEMTAVRLYFSGGRPPCDLAALRVRAIALFRRRSIWPLGKVTQISPIH